MKGANTFSALRHRNFRLYWSGALVSLVGTWVQQTAQTYLVWELTRSPLATSLPLFFFTLPSLLFSLVGGVIADRVNRRRLLLLTQSLFAAQAAVLTALTWFDVVRVGHINALAFASGLVMAVDAPARQSLVPNLVRREDLTNAIALNSLVFNASRIVGPPIGGLLYAVRGPELAFLFNTLSFAAILYPLAILALPPEGEGRRATTMWDDLWEGLRFVWGHPVVRTVLLLVALMGTFGFSYVVLMPVMTTQILGGGPAQNGYLLGAVGVGATVGALLVAATARSGHPGRRLLWLGALAGGALLTFAASRSLPVAAVVLFAVGGLIIGFLATANATIQRLIPDALRGRTMSVYSLALLGSGPANSLLAGALGSAVGAPRAIAITGLLIIVPMILVALLSRSLVGTSPPSVDGSLPSR
ncbi:MAG: MFS transporter [bacterium]